MLLFADEDDVVKFFISAEEKNKKKMLKMDKGDKKKKIKILPIFAEAIDNLVTTLIALVIGIMLHFKVLVDYLYIIDDVSNMVISAVMCIIACRGLWKLSNKYQNKSHEDNLL